MQKHLPVPVYEYIFKLDSGILKGATGLVKLPGVIDEDDDRHWGLALVLRTVRAAHQSPVLVTIPIGIYDRLSVVVREMPRAEVIEALKVATESMAARDVLYRPRMFHTVMDRGREHIDRLLAEMEEARREVRAHGVIRAAWLEANSNPNHAVCRRRLRREFAGLAGGGGAP